MSDSFRAKYLEALKKCNDWVIVSEWAQRFGEMYPDLLEKANREAATHAHETTGIREIAARISSIISEGGYEGRIEIDTSERPRKVRYIPDDQRKEHESQEIEEDVAPLRRNEIIGLARQTLSSRDLYRETEFESIAKQLKAFFGLEFEVDHARSLLNKSAPGSHHPDNFQLLLKAHNARKNNENWQRFSLEEQIEYISAAIRLQEIVAPRFKINMEMKVLESLVSRLKNIY